jgi:1-acyl-sn-glycerol-3-phosphate acyltransferase
MNGAKFGATTAEEIEHRTLRGWPRRIVRAMVLGILWVVPRVRLVNVDRVPASGGVLVVANHLHNADPVFVNAAYPRALHFMAKKEAFSFPPFRFFLEAGGAFPVDRGKSDRKAIKRAQATLAAGIALGIFPEGTRSPTRALQKAHSGAGLLALLSGAPVQPVVVTGTERLPLNGSRGKLAPGATSPDPGHSGVRILFGEPFLVPRTIEGRTVTSDEATAIIMIEVARLLPPGFRGVYAELLDNEIVRRALPFSG